MDIIDGKERIVNSKEQSADNKEHPVEKDNPDL